MCFDDLKRVNGVLCDSYAKACISHGIIDDGREIDRVVEESANANVSGDAKFWQIC